MKMEYLSKRSSPVKFMSNCVFGAFINRIELCVKTMTQRGCRLT